MFYEGNAEGSRVLYRMALDSGAQATLVAKETLPEDSRRPTDGS